MYQPEITRKDARYAYISLWHENKGIMQKMISTRELLMKVHGILYGTPVIDKTMNMLPIYHHTTWHKLHLQYQTNVRLSTELIHMRLKNMSLRNERCELRVRARHLRKSLRLIQNKRRANYKANSQFSTYSNLLLFLLLASYY